ncbi:MAG: DUF4105 domain-containing protein [Candidatus Competibacteraceae bacterium]|nr:DUF4105 domain-containing protein [Candidatus Competibacteraceae bacterium]MCP5127747.1 DUF4105 domain-containing protein [Gammaproteobacteria bacterium]HRX70150.1 DUF4105 domain-containing protein [Candidatus Competibacteraceae bacterium]
MSRIPPLISSVIRRCCFIFLLGFLLPGREAQADYLNELLDRADRLNLAERREWRTLLHYRSASDDERVISDADDARFFLAPTGKNDPQAELAATLRAFFITKPVGADPQPAQCAFIARYRWLRTELDVDDQRLPPQTCVRFQHWLRELNAESVTLVFASAYLNNPASLFGHTLLRLNQRGQTDRTRLLAYTISYAADDSGSHSLMYAINGITGGFRGQFDIQPYYQMVRIYSDLESRDIWEYRLNLSPLQLQRMLEHVWELRGIEFDYYFLRENCAWQLLTLLEAADPNLQFSDQFTLWTLPADTLRLLDQQPGLVGEVISRPARGTAIRRRQQALSREELRLVRQVRSDPKVAMTPAFTALALERQALLLELALDQRQHQQTDRLEKGRATPPDRIAHQLLTARQRLAVPAAPVVIEPYATRPETGHASRRAGMGLGQRNRKEFLELTARASGHDLLESDAGYTRDAQIEVLSMAIRYYLDHGGWQLDRLTLLDITSLTPFDPLAPHPAWRIHIGWQPAPQDDCPDCRTFNINGSLGVAMETSWPGRALWFALPELELDYSPDLSNDYRAGWGITLGALLQPATNWKILARINGLNYQWGETGTIWQTTVGQNLALGRDWALQMEWRTFRKTHEFALGLRAYF